MLKYPNFFHLISLLSLSARRMSAAVEVDYLAAAAARELDESLLRAGYRLEQLVELAGLGVAQAVARRWPEARSALVVCGPGNNGADGLVAARHLSLWGRRVSVLYPRPGRDPLYADLLRQALAAGVTELPADTHELPPDTDVAVDALFGFSFAGPARAPLDAALRLLETSRVPVASVDVPSGWAVDEAEPGGALRPALLVSLSLPKPCARGLAADATHVLAGRFVPAALWAALGVRAPPYRADDTLLTLRAPAENQTENIAK